MPKPFPIIYAPAGPARDKVIDAIYAAGWSMNGSRKREDAVLPRTKGYDLYDFIHLHDNRTFVYRAGPYKDCTMVNSPTHLIAYCRTLGEHSPKSLIVKPLPAPPDQPF